MSDSFFDQQNAGYVQLLYEEFSKNPDAVPESWRRFFSQGPQVVADAGLLIPDTLRQPEVPPPPPQPHGAPGSVLQALAGDTEKLLPVVARAAALVQAFRDHGHQLAKIDPLGSEPPGHPQLDPGFFGTTMEELEEIPASVIDPRWGEQPLAEVLKRLEAAYCGSIGFQFEHLEDPEKVRWLWDQVETETHTQPLGAEEKKRLLKRLSQVEGLEHFLHRAYLGQKRFSLEGTDMMVPMLDQAIEEAARYGGREVFIGMAHRGRLNVLAHLVGVGYEEIIRGFEGKAITRSALSVPKQGTGDVKYHHGAEGVFTNPDGTRVKVTLAPNPSHLEFVNPVVEGMTRARQFGGPEKDRPLNTDEAIPVLIHGDSAFAAEGIVAETLNLARLDGYATGGTLHIIANNQVGFTTEPAEGRSTRYSSDMAKGYDVPIIHVNADDAEACLAAVRIAMAFRARFHDDIVIDLIGYRRHGHNEGDEPAYTQPQEYKAIGEHPTVRTIWAQHLRDTGVLSPGEGEAMQEEVAGILRDAQDRVRGEEDAGPGSQEEEETVAPPARIGTCVPLQDLVRLNEATLARPEGFKTHPKLDRQLQKRLDGFSGDSPLEWAHAETLALASLLEDGIPVRLSGQDSQRGTFSQRHLVLHDVENGTKHTPLAEIGSARFEVYNSPLTETAVLGFEYGYDVGIDPCLVLWEAQFGDFVNVAQVIIDQFIASGRAKWGQLTRLTLLLPHGHEGQGPEHTSARLERFLQLCAEDNMRVAYPTTPAQYFHLLRRQALSPNARPLVIMTPKSLLRHPRATSTPAELAEGEFYPVLGDPAADTRHDEITRLVLCTGKIYYDIETHRKRGDSSHVAVARLEQLYPFPGKAVEALVASFPRLEEIVWVQEEPMNQGALSFVGPRLRSVVPRRIPMRHVARPGRASPAEGKNKDHLDEQERIVVEGLGLPK